MATATPARRRTKKVQIDDSAVPVNQGSSAEPKLNRIAFSTEMAMDFFTEKGLIKQTGHDLKEWPYVILKELVDNGLDACEDKDIAPVIEVVANETGITIRDNGPGLPGAVLNGTFDYKRRISTREKYVSPCRGAQGNALKSIGPMPVLVDPGHGKLIVKADGFLRAFRCRLNPIEQRPDIKEDEPIAMATNQSDFVTWRACVDLRCEVACGWTALRLMSHRHQTHEPCPTILCVRQ